MNKVITKVSKKYNKFKLALVGLSASILVSPACTFCGGLTVKENVTTAGVMGGILGVIVEIAKWVGIALAASGIFQLILAYKDDNADGQSRAVRLVVVAIALLSLKALLKTAGLIA